MLAVAPAGAAGFTKVYGDVQLQSEYASFTNQSDHGYVDYAFTLTNRSSDTPHTIRITLPRYTYNHYNHHLRSMSRMVELGPGETRRISLFQPDLPLNGGGAELVIDGKVHEEGFAVNFQYSRGSKVVRSTSVRGPFVYHSQQAGIAGFVHAANSRVIVQGQKPPPVLPSLPLGNLQWYRSDGPVTGWSSNWLGYSSYDAVVLTAAEARQLEREAPAVLDALWRYAEVGGYLVFLGDAKVPPTWKRQIQTLPGNVVGYYPGFGQCRVCTTTDMNFWQWQGPRWHSLMAPLFTTAYPWHTVRTMTEANRAFPVVSNQELSVPVRGLFVLMIGFAFAIGPLNLFVLTKKNRKIWLLWSVPLVSLLTSGAVFGYMLVAEGWQGHARTDAITLLDEPAGRATTLGWAAFYTPLTPADGLHFDYDTELTPQVAGEMYVRGSGTGRTVDWSNDQHLKTGWVTARAPAHFTFRRAQASRLRLTVERGSDGTPTATNLLSAGIRKLWVADGRGNVFAGEDISAGAKASLRPVVLPNPAGRVQPPRQLLQGDWLLQAKKLRTQPGDYLQPGTYIADLDGGPFTEEGLKSVRFRQDEGVVFGILKEPLP